MVSMSERGKRAAVRIAALLTILLLFMQVAEGAAVEYRERVLFSRECGWGAVIVPEAESLKYRRINLEDGEQMDAVTAGKIRAIVRAAANERFLEGETPVEGLRDEDVLAAVGAAICHVLGEDVPAPGDNASALVQYLITLSPVVPDTLVVSDSTVHVRSAEAQRLPDGTYRLEVEFTTTATWSPGDDLTVTVTCGNAGSSFPLGDENMDAVHRVVLSTDARPAEVRVEVGGCQRGEDVFLFVHPEKTDLLIGWDDRVLPVYGETTAGVVYGRIPPVHDEGLEQRHTVTVVPTKHVLTQGDMYLIWWVALICGLLTGTGVAAALLLRLKGKK